MVSMYHRLKKNYPWMFMYHSRWDNVLYWTTLTYHAHCWSHTHTRTHTHTHINSALYIISWISTKCVCVHTRGIVRDHTHVLDNRTHAGHAGHASSALMHNQVSLIIVGGYLSGGVVNEKWFSKQVAYCRWQPAEPCDLMFRGIRVQRR